MKNEQPIHISAAKAACVTLLALALSFVLANPLTASLSAVFASPERGDFRVTDLYFQVADARPVRQLDDRIVLVDIRNADRVEIAECLRLLSLSGPKAVGVDINFADAGNSDSIISDAVERLPLTVLPLGVERTAKGDFRITDQPFFFKNLKNVKYGVANLPSEDEGSSIREYATYYPMVSGDSLPSFALAMAEMGADPAAADSRRDGKMLHTIDYASREFKVIPIDEAKDNAELFSDKYVMIGAKGDADDMHSTPINSYMSGMMIHAYSLSTLLDRKTFSQMPLWMDYIIALVLCFGIVFAAIRIQSKLRGITLRFAQMILLILTVWAGYSLFLDSSLVCNLTHTVLMLTFGLLALDVWNGLEEIAAIITGRRRKTASHFAEAE